MRWNFGVKNSFMIFFTVLKMLAEIINTNYVGIRKVPIPTFPAKIYLSYEFQKTLHGVSLY